MGLNAFPIYPPHSGDPLPGDNCSLPPRSDLFPGLLPDAGSNGQGSALRSVDADGVIASEITETARETSSDTARYDALVRLFRAIGHYKSPAELTSVLAAEASQLIQFDFIGISRCDDAMSAVEWHIAIPGKGIEHGSIEATRGETITGWVYERQKPVVIAALDRETRLQSNILQAVQEGIQSVCAVPLSCTQSKLGALLVGSVLANAYSEGEVRFLSLVATQVCCAIENNLAYEQVAELKDRLEHENLYLEEEIRE